RDPIRRIGSEGAMTAAAVLSHLTLPLLAAAAHRQGRYGVGSGTSIRRDGSSLNLPREGRSGFSRGARRQPHGPLPLSLAGRTPHRPPHRRRDLRPEQLDRAQHLVVRDGADTELREEALVAEQLVLEQDLVDDL